ncbi:MAG TPA: isoprenylcysteine carboxylmethyltransferase family protein [Polyangiaceae bacterium]|jgi:protein-S-isoprenylcysteine O-methyltransferase Ste14|nr:isoprenylcysteine carboxylmethyltransferase family protein [Polyangiaceae bacterium]
MLKFLFRRGFILPVVVTGLVPLLITLFTHAERGVRWWSLLAGLFLFLVGFALLLSTTTLFQVHGGSLAPWNPPKSMVISGPYRYVRNPMILGIFLMLIGEAVGLHSRWIGLWFAMFFTGQQIYILFDEEPALRHRFGQQYLRYCREVPRWIPRLTRATLRNSPS